MSFMFNPYPYEDLNPVNKPSLDNSTVDSVISGTKEAAIHLADQIKKQNGKKMVIGMDGYISAEWDQMINLISQQLSLSNIDSEAIDIASCYKSSEELDELLTEHLPEDLVQDPIQLFGKHLDDPSYDLLMDAGKRDSLKDKIFALENVVFVYGAGSCCEELIGCYDLVLFFDVTPKQTILRIKKGRVKNLGDKEARPFKKLMRRCYYFDFELAMHLRMNLLKNDLIDYYISSDNPDNMMLVPKSAFNEICKSVVNYPFRCKPVYLEGIWGGTYIKNLRHLPKEMKNCAWIFDLIPLEVSLLIQTGEKILEIPFFTFVCKEGNSLMGEECVKAFNGYFPIRFNYDDTYHSNGNMSVQLHPTDEYIKEQNNEHGRQDESYYVVATGHGAKTFLGLKEGSDPEEFIEEIKKSEVDHSLVDYEKYIDHVDSTPGVQVMIPAGTIHSSGRNQVVLEIGSLTVGSYTYKVYDYLRKDFDGVPRPIHSYHGDRTLNRNYTTSWVKENLVQEPKLVRSGEDWAEYIIGEHDLLYFSLRRYEFQKKIEGDTNGVFHVLSLVDGEKVAIYAKNNPDFRYEPNFMDIVVVPANIGPYVIENLGEQPVCVHKTCLKENFTESI